MQLETSGPPFRGGPFLCQTVFLSDDSERQRQLAFSGDPLMVFGNAFDAVARTIRGNIRQWHQMTNFIIAFGSGPRRTRGQHHDLADAEFVFQDHNLSDFGRRAIRVAAAKTERLQRLPASALFCATCADGRFIMPFNLSRSASKLAISAPSSERPRGSLTRIGSTNRPLTRIS